MPSRKPEAIIDIGSNSVRLVVYSGAERIPTPIFNEKVMAGLGAGLSKTGELSQASMERALTALCRYQVLIRHMRARPVRVVATAAVREARNGPEFVRQIRSIGLDCEVLGEEEEARLAGEGVLSAIPDASGIVGDLGGGSLELVQVGKGRAKAAISLPLGVLQAEASQNGESQARQLLRAVVRKPGFAEIARGKPFYMVGGSWRALARVHMIATKYPLPVTHQYAMQPSQAEQLRQLVGSPDINWSKAASAARLASAPVAAMILSVLVDELEPSELIVSTFGIREGLLFTRLPPVVRKRDPLLEAARDAGEAERRFGPHGDLLDEWIGELFDDSAEMRRLRLASCLLADVAWQATAPFRADRAIEMALHGNWVGIDARGRVLVAQALSSSFGRDKLPSPSLAELCSAGELQRAHQWGASMRLGQRLSAGVGSALEGTRLSRNGKIVQLIVERDQSAIIGEAVRSRLSRLAGAFDCQPEIVVVD